MVSKNGAYAERDNVKIVNVDSETNSLGSEWALGIYSIERKEKKRKGRQTECSSFCYHLLYQLLTVISFIFICFYLPLSWKQEGMCVSVCVFNTLIAVEEDRQRSNTHQIQQPVERL